MRTTTRADRVLDAVEEVCASASTADALLEALSAEMHRWVPHDGSLWFGMDPVTMLATAPSRVEGLEGGLCETFWHLEFHEQDTGLLSDLARDGGVSALRLDLDERVSRSPRYREFMKPQGYGDELRAALRTDGSPWGVVSLYREGGHRPFDRDDVAAIDSIRPVVARALRSHVRELSPWLAQPDAPGLLVLGQSNRIVSANAEAEAWLQEICPIPSGADGLDYFDAFAASEGVLDVPTPIYALVARARAIADGRERAPARLRVRDRRGRWLVLHASALAGPGTSAPDQVALVIEAAKSAEIAPIIIEAYSLTPRERDVVAGIARGGSTAEIAAELFVSPHTVRDHVKTLFEKVGVSSRGELVARLFGEHYLDRFKATMVHVD